MIPDNVEVVLDPESEEHVRALCAPLTRRLAAFFGTGTPVVTARAVVGHFFDFITDINEYHIKWREFAATLPFPVVPSDRCVDVARRLKEYEGNG